MQLHIIYLRSGRMLLSKKAYASWHEIQDEFEDYMTSLGPWSAEEVVEFLREEYPDNTPFTNDQMRSFVNGSEWILE